MEINGLTNNVTCFARNKIDKISKYTSQFMFKVSKTLITMSVSFGHGNGDLNQCAASPPHSHVVVYTHNEKMLNSLSSRPRNFQQRLSTLIYILDNIYS